MRQAEQRASAARLGVSEVVYLQGFPDGHVADASGLVREVVAAIRRWRPSLVLSMSPEGYVRRAAVEAGAGAALTAASTAAGTAASTAAVTAAVTEADGGGRVGQDLAAPVLGESFYRWVLRS